MPSKTRITMWVLLLPIPLMAADLRPALDTASQARDLGRGEDAAASVGHADARSKDKGTARSPNLAEGVATQQSAAVLGAQPLVDAPAAKAATDAAIAYLNALKEKGVAAAPAFLHPAAMARFKTLAMPGLKDEQARGTRNLLNATFGRDASYATAAAAEPADFLVRFARLIAAREPDSAPRFSGLAPIGVVREGDQLHVLVRLNLDGTGLDRGGAGTGAGSEAVERIEVVSLRHDGREWKVMLDSRLQDLARTLGSRPRADERRGGLPRLEPLPEGLAPIPPAPPGPAGAPSPPGLSGPQR